jgi:hypothetical protein
VGKPLSVSRVAERGSPKSDLWNHRGFSPVRMSKCVGFILIVFLASKKYL